jgi:hypothetical protein
MRTPRDTGIGFFISIDKGRIRKSRNSEIECALDGFDAADGGE